MTKPWDYKTRLDEIRELRAELDQLRHVLQAVHDGVLPRGLIAEMVRLALQPDPAHDDTEEPTS